MQNAGTRCKTLYYLEIWHRKRNPIFPQRKKVPIKSSFIPAIYENFEIIKALIIVVLVIHNKLQEMKKFPQNDSNIVMYGFKVPKRILHTVNLLIPRIMRYEDIRAFLPVKNQLSGNRNFNTT